MLKLYWKDKFGENALSNALKYIDNVSDMKVQDNEITAIVKKSTPFNVKIKLNENNIIDMECSCSSKDNCKHQAAVLMCLDKSILESLVMKMDEDILRDYLLKILYDNQDLKIDFIGRFEKEQIFDPSYYYNKLDYIIDCAKGNDYFNVGYYDVDVLANGILIFLEDEVDKLMNMQQYKVVFDLMNRIGEVLCDEMYANEFSWYDACESYLQIFNVLEERDVLSDDDYDELYNHASFMINYGVC